MRLKFRFSWNPGTLLPDCHLGFDQARQSTMSMRLTQGTPVLVQGRPLCLRKNSNDISSLGVLLLRDAPYPQILVVCFMCSISGWRPGYALLPHIFTMFADEFVFCHRGWIIVETQKELSIAHGSLERRHSLVLSGQYLKRLLMSIKFVSLSSSIYFAIGLKMGIHATI